MNDDVAVAATLLARGAEILDEVGITLPNVITEPAAFVAMLAGDPALAERHLRGAYDSLRRMGEQANLATSAALLAQTIAAQGSQRYDEAETLIAISRQAGDGQDLTAQTIGNGVQARILAARGQLRESVAMAEAATQLAAQTDLLSQHGDALRDQAHVLVTAGLIEQALESIQQALRLYEAKGNQPYARACFRFLAQYGSP